MITWTEMRIKIKRLLSNVTSFRCLVVFSIAYLIALDCLKCYVDVVDCCHGYIPVNP